MGLITNHHHNCSHRNKDYGTSILINIPIISETIWSLIWRMRNGRKWVAPNDHSRIFKTENSPEAIAAREHYKIKMHTECDNESTI